MRHRPIVVYPPTGSTAYEREMSTPPTLLLEYGPPLIALVIVMVMIWIILKQKTHNVDAVHTASQCQKQQLQVTVSFRHIVNVPGQS